MTQAAFWRKCTICKAELTWGQAYWVCNVSTCNRRRTSLRFCTVACFDAHLPTLNHREAWALEVKAPGLTQWNEYRAKEGDDAVWPPAVRSVQTPRTQGASAGPKDPKIKDAAPKSTAPSTPSTPSTPSRVILKRARTD